MRDNGRKTLKAVAIAALTLMMILLPLSPALAGRRVYRVNASSGLNMRYKANSSSAIVTTLRRGTSVREIRSKGNWMYVETKSGKRGYCYKKYLTLSGRPLSDPDEKPKMSGDLAYVCKAGGLKAYRSPSKSSRVKGKLRSGSIVRLISYRGNWGYIKTMTGNVGYVELSDIDKFTG